MTCPVCGFNFLRDDAVDHGICPSCGTEFGYDDATRTHEALRFEWLQNGGEWFDRSIGPVPDWDPLVQVITAFYAPRLTTSTPRKPITSEFKLDIPLTPIPEVLRIAG
jgi:hypothetical protein